MNKNIFVMAILCMVLTVISGCIVERKTGVFREPTKEELENALSLYVQISYKYMENKNYDLAMVNANKALEIDPHSPLALTAMAVLYQTQGDIDKARKYFESAISKDSNFSPARMNYGQFLFQQKEYEKACTHFKKASENDLYDKRYAAFYNLGLCLKALDQNVEAEAAFMRAVALQPDYPPVTLELAQMKFQQKSYPESKGYFDKYAKIAREAKQVMGPDAVWLGIQLERVFGNKDAEASLALLLKNVYPYSREYLEYKKSVGAE